MGDKWNAEKYTADFSFVSGYGKDVLNLLTLPPRARVLDLGCGNGVLTKELSLRGYRALGLDSSEELLSLARRTYQGINFILADATNFSLEKRVDGVFSNAVLHWISKEKQPLALGCVNRALESGGQFVFEMGGLGNNALIHAALKREFAVRGMTYKTPFFFPGEKEYFSLLKESGFEVTDMRLFERPTPLKGEDGMKDWLEMFIKAPFVGVLGGVKKDIITAATKDLRATLYKNGVWFADYVRLRGRAIKK